MIGDPASYALADFIPFSRETLDAVQVRYSQVIWPSQLFWMVANVFVLAACWRYGRGRSRFTPRRFARVLAGVMIVAWSFVALAYVNPFLTPLTPGAPFVLFLFLAQAFLAALVLGHPGKPPLPGPDAGAVRTWSALGLFFLAAFVPLEIAWGAGLRQLLLFGWGADHTAVGTLGLALLCTRGWRRWMLLPIPLLWIGLSLTVALALPPAS